MTGCMPEQAVRRPVSIENNNVSNTNNTNETTEDTNSAPSDPDNIFWQDNGVLSNILTIDETASKNIFIYSDYLSDEFIKDDLITSPICAIATFQATLDKTPKELRVLLIPQSSYNPTKGKTVRYYKTNLSDEAMNQNCNLTKFDKINSTYNQVPYSSSNVANKLEDICTNCLNIITSLKFKIYETHLTTAQGPDLVTYTNGLIAEYDNQKGFQNLVLRVDMNNNSSNNSPSCNNTDCQAQGFDCCLSGQCVKDGGQKNTRTEVQQIATDLGDPSYLTQFDYAQAQKVTNPLIYLQYPQYYYICLENVPNDGSSGPLDPSDPAGDARKRLKEMISDYYCIEELKTNSVADPFHTDPWNGSISASTYKVCNQSDDPGADPDMFYKDVMSRMYKHCGCVSDTYNEQVANCPKYTYKPIYNTSGSDFKLTDLYTLMTNESVSSPLNIEDLADETDIARIECVSPEVDPNNLPFADMDVIVNSKTAPHRFFDANTNSGESIEITDMNDLPVGASGEQEGDTFQYLDDQKVFPLNGQFNMNSILGQMTVDLSQARPATMVSLEFDKMYYIATIEGFYTPCPSCAKDYWFPNFSPNPTTTQGVGLQSIGYTTRRDAWGSNTTFGNYEDTIFGRACWLPPTMLPFSHNENADQQTQRLNRLKTQAAYYSNGYQRDWFGFNKGALIGSFDGVSWFAVGKGRVVKSTTDKLFLAINAPFADLAQYNDHLVSVQEWDFITTAPQYDYNPDEDINSVFQNEAGLCQRNHQCENDSDCITQLGWEYSCVDVNQYQTKWPRFTAEGSKEIANDSATGSIISFLNQGELPSGTSSKKCVYRGAGAPCRVNYDSITDAGQRRALACAPNFYCAALTSGSTFNYEIARFASVLEDVSESKNHYFGREANHLGRPKQYLGTTGLGSLPSDVQTAIDANLTTLDATGSGDFGLCRPGKSLPDYQGITSTANSNFTEQQKDPDLEYRTDFISQISGCNSALYTNLRYSSCPMIGEDGNYVHLTDEYISDTTIIESINPNNYITSTGLAQIYGHSQNSCGMEILSSGTGYGAGITANTLKDYSAFKSLEAGPLSESKVHYEPTLVRDACYRKAGAVCHTDLDCSPNYKHADLIDILNPALFGNDAEKKYWQEYLVCGQGNKEPLVPSDPDFNTYDITNNRCCREIGKEITMYSEDMPGVTESQGLQTNRFGGYHPSDPNRYSRYNNLSTHFIDESSRLPSGGFIRPSANSEASAGGNLTNVINILNGNQWKTINGSAKRTCCGGGWIRKFADGTNNWMVNRLNLDVTNFKCLNFNTPLVNTDSPEPFGLTNTENNQDSQNLCIDASSTVANCAQLSFGDLDGYTPSAPILHSEPGKMVLETIPADMEDKWNDNLWAFNPLQIADDGDPTITYLDWGKEDPNTNIEDGATRRNLAFKIPSFITWNSNESFDSEVEVWLEAPSDTNNEYVKCTATTPPSSYDCGTSGAWHGLCSASDPVSPSAWETACPVNAGQGNKNCCYVYEPISRVLKVAHNYQMTQDTAQASNYQLASNFGEKPLGMRIIYTAPGTLQWEKDNVGAQPVTEYMASDVTGNHSVLDHRRSATPGNAYYYLRKLERFELLGIPQITYEPLYCNDNYQKVVPGLFKTEVDGAKFTNINEVNAHPNTFLTNYSLGSMQESWVKPFQNENLPTSPQDYTALEVDSINEPRLTTQEMVDHEAVFSSHEFMCCSPLGTEVNQSDVGNCCSGYGEASTNSPPTGEAKYICKLAPGTDLNIYFNKFVSGEGMSESEENPLTEDDFDPYTGYPVFSQSVIQKLKGLAQTHCAGDNGTYVRGGAFGPYVAEPHGSLPKNATEVYSLLDSVYDDGNNTDQPAGFSVFNQGQRWNHHIYCDPNAGGDN